MLNDVFGWYKRSVKTMKPYQIQKTIKELSATVEFLKKELPNINK